MHGRKSIEICIYCTKKSLFEARDLIQSEYKTSIYRDQVQKCIKKCHTRDIEVECASLLQNGNV